jgi:signal transduction histidine kinase
MSTPSAARSSADPLRAFGQRYRTIFNAYLTEGSETWLMEAYELARTALAKGLGLGDVCSLHFATVQVAGNNQLISTEAQQRADQIFLEVMSVYDMALQGYERAMQQLRSEIVERRQIEDQLREASAELEAQRDDLDSKVLQRTHELAEKAEDLERALQHLTQTNREQAEFTYAISHDLKSPNNTIRMLIDELSLSAGADLNADAQELLDLARQTTERMARLVDDVLAYSRCIEDQAVMVPVDLDQLFATITADLRSDIATAGAVVEVAPLPVVWGVPVQMKLLFQNLTANAVKFRAPGRVPLIRITQKPKGGQVLISVRDNGIGIAPEHHQRVFGLFQRLHDHSSYQGSGLGLALCKRIMTNHAGDIRLDSTPGEGSCFTVSLKRHVP